MSSGETKLVVFLVVGFMVAIAVVGLMEYTSPGSAGRVGERIVITVRWFGETIARIGGAR